MSLLTMSAQLAEGFLITVEIFVLTLLFSLPLGLIVAFGRMSGCKVIRIISKIYISIMRGTPLMLQIIVVYFAPFYVFRMQVGTGYRFPAVILAGSWRRSLAQRLQMVQRQQWRLGTASGSPQRQMVYVLPHSWQRHRRAGVRLSLRPF